MPETVSEIAIILLLLLLNGLFAMSEIAVVSARPLRLQQMALRGNRGARAALDLADSPNRFLSTVQVGITLVGIFAGAFGGANIAGELAESLRGIGPIERYAESISLVIVVGTITFLSVVIGELVPKRIALSNAERIAALVARPMHALSVIATPVVRLFSLATDIILKLLGVRAPQDEEVNEEEIRLMVQQGAEAGILEEVESSMVESVFRLGDRPLESVMTPRPEIVWLDVNATDAEISDRLRAAQNTRFPVCDGSLDQVLGVVQAKDLLASCLEGQPVDLRAMMQEPLLIPEQTPALKALERFKQSGLQVALVFDEYGGIEGLVTLIDILEAIVGDIPTLNEMIEPPIVQREDGSWLVDGLIPIEDFKEEYTIQSLPGEGKYQTLGGFVVFMLGAIPATGSRFDWGRFRFEVADMDRYRVDKVLLSLAPENETDSGGMHSPNA